MTLNSIKFSIKCLIFCYSPYSKLSACPYHKSCECVWSDTDGFQLFSYYYMCLCDMARNQAAYNAGSSQRAYDVRMFLPCPEYCRSYIVEADESIGNGE